MTMPPDKEYQRDIEDFYSAAKLGFPDRCAVSEKPAHVV